MQSFTLGYWVYLKKGKIRIPLKYEKHDQQGKAAFNERNPQAQQGQIENVADSAKHNNQTYIISFFFNYFRIILNPAYHLYLKHNMLICIKCYLYFYSFLFHYFFYFH
jgi:hypothetical protein